jgi:predicted nuclease of predicted toxin-antitoxin system
MRLLLDENFPATIATDFVKDGFEVMTVYSLGWVGTKNGLLLKRAPSVCDVFVTLDKSLPFQHNISALSIGIVLVKSNSNRRADLIPLIEKVFSAALVVQAGQVMQVQFD